jgi:citrate synthase
VGSGVVWGVEVSSQLRTRLASNDLHHIWLQGLDLTGEVMGNFTFTEVMFLLIAGRKPDQDETKLVDAVLVALMEHGLTPSAVVARVTYSLVPEAIQGATAAGLLGVGGVVLGSMEDCGQILTRVVEATGSGVAVDEAMREVVAEYRTDRRMIPGVGHAIHTEGDPRAGRLLEIAGECGKRGAYVEAAEALEREVGRSTGRSLPLNVTGAVAAVLLELGIPWRLHRGFALISRTAGLIAHIREELEDPITPAFRALTRGAPAEGTPA